ncbi:Dihydropyrimidinase-related protein 4 [Echinococcus granulosus]|uniref:Dihydropyrimidinase protein 4 n=1 Tax=Echinococcus granulosus TaxID=6210 RepID=A0A068WCI7_ECHGR|nr:Dihydropyrimidinase-related protein 4 [Echinococcus granulosus]CDS17454.1 dihydropyrimidinase protein 4 [Echinococcus granulosus]
MSNSEWERPGIVPGLQGDSQQKRPSIGRASSGLFGYVADPNDSKTPPGIGEQDSRVTTDSQLAHEHIDGSKSSVVTEVLTQKLESSLKMTGDLFIRGGRIMDCENTCNTDILIKNGKISAFGEALSNEKQVQEIDATNLVISPGLVDFSATSHAFSSKLGAEGMADQASIREATSRAVLAGVTTIVDTVYSDDGQSPLSSVAAYLQALQTTYIHCNVAVRAGIRHLSVGTISDIELLTKRHHIKSFLLAIPENDRILCERGNPESTVLYGVLSTCRNLGIVPMVGLDKITGSQIPQMEGDPDLRLAAIAIRIAKLAGCPIVLSPVRSAAVMHKIYTSQREHPPLPIYADFAADVFIESSMSDQAPYIAADGNIILSSGESYVLSTESKSSEVSWIQEAYRKIVGRGWGSECHMIEASCKRPAQLAGLSPQKGQLAIGADADLVLWSEGDCSKPVFTIVGGRIAVQYGRLRETTPRDREEGKGIKAGFIRSGRSPCDTLVVVYEKIREMGKVLQPVLSPPQPLIPTAEQATKRLENVKPGPSGDAALAGLPSREMRSIASQYKREFLASTFKLTGEQKGDDRPIRPNIKIWQGKNDSPRPY